ncbi:MAG: hypothetical protein KBD53_08255 [Candidatus Omnitrophica bacterium]|nr:hypothetical protein [Candidatus Omnitrophota bacterium]
MESTNKKVLLAYIDILGYSEYVRVNSNPLEFKIQLEGIFDSVKEQFQRITNTNSEEYHIVRDYIHMALANLEFCMFSDSLIIWLDVDDSVDAFRIPEIAFKNAEHEKRWVSGITDSIYRFFLQNIAMTVFMLTCETHLLTRGGISFGSFHSSTFKEINGEYLFSQALIDAVNLERNARMPRIIISDEIHERLKDSKWMDHSLIWTDTDGENVLDIYHFPKFFTGLPEMIERCFKGHLKTSNKDSFNKIISKRLDEYSFEKESNRNIRDIWNKWHWFKEYHNKRMQEIDKRFVI